MELKDALNAASARVTARLKDELGNGVFTGFVQQARSIGEHLS
jgi:hypothetical protein